MTHSLKDTLAGCLCEWAGVDLGGSSITASKWRENITAEGRKPRDDKEGTHECVGVPAQVRGDR